MRVDTFSYDLPPSLIAQAPTASREDARLMVLPQNPLAPLAESMHTTVADLASFIPRGALVVLNDTRVIPARLLGRKPETGGKVEVFLLRRVEVRAVELAPGTVLDCEVWHALGKSSKPLKFGGDVVVTRENEEPATGASNRPAPLRRELRVRLLGRSEADGLLEVALWSPNGGPIDDLIREVGHVPLPPYIKRDEAAADAERYQTVFARHDGAVAAPTAGLHLTRALLGRLAVRECEVTTVTLHVGLGTFQPVQVEDLDQHAMHAEHFEITRTAAAAIARARERGAPVVAVGTTVVRALESAANRSPRGHEGLVEPMAGETRLLIQPGYPFKVVDFLLTNFHLPRSTLLAMVCAFGGTERMLAAYADAVERAYRFFSYGDAMFLRRADAGAPPFTAGAPRAPNV